MDKATFTTVLEYTIGVGTLKALVAKTNPGAQNNNVHLRLDLDEEAHALLAPLFQPEEKEETRDA